MPVISEEELFNDTYDKIMELAKQENYLILELKMRINDAEDENKDIGEEIGVITRTTKALQQQYDFLAPLLDQIVGGVNKVDGYIYPLALETYERIMDLKTDAKEVLELKRVLDDLKDAKEACNKKMSENKTTRMEAERYLKDFLDIQATLKKYLGMEAEDIDLSPKQFIKFLQKFKTADGEPIFAETEYKSASDIVIWKKERYPEYEFEPEVITPIIEFDDMHTFDTQDIDDLIEGTAEEHDLEEEQSEEQVVIPEEDEPEVVEEKDDKELSENGKRLVALGKNIKDVELCDSILKNISPTRLEAIIDLLESKGIDPKTVPVIAFTYSERHIENYTDAIRIAKEQGIETTLSKDPVYAYETGEQELYDRIGVVSAYGAKLTNGADITRICKLHNISDVLASSMELGSDLFVEQISTVPFSKVTLADNKTINESKKESAETIKEWFDKGGLVTKLSEVSDHVGMDPNSFAELTDYLEEISKRADESSQNGYYRFGNILVPRNRVEENLRKLVSLSNERKTDTDTIILMSLIYGSARSKDEIEELGKVIIAPRIGGKVV